MEDMGNPHALKRVHIIDDYEPSYSNGHTEVAHHQQLVPDLDAAQQPVSSPNRKTSRIEKTENENDDAPS
jgi:hypothetical protein